MSPERPIEPTPPTSAYEPPRKGTTAPADGGEVDGGEDAPKSKRSIQIRLPLPRTFQGRRIRPLSKPGPRQLRQ